VTFRRRVAASAAAVVAIAVVLACAIAFHVSRDALVGSADSSLYDAYEHMVNRAVVAPVAGIGVVLVDPAGQELFASAGQNLPVDDTIRSVAKGTEGLQYRTISATGGVALRELVAPLPIGTIIDDYQSGPWTLSTSAALVIFEPIQGIEDHLNSLRVTLLVLALFGVLGAAFFGWLAARASLVPLTSTTSEIEDVANTLDVSRRVDEGRDDELGRLRRACNRLLEALQGAQDAQRQLILDSSHELRTPLTSLRTNAQVLRRAGELSHDDLTQLSEDMVTQVDELTTLVRDLMELAQGTHSVEEDQDLRLDDLVAECTELAETHARTRQVTVQLSTEPCMVHARPSRLSRAIGNLLDNAIKFSPSGGEVRVTCRGAVVTVEDAGPGIADVDVPYVFDRFYRSPRDRGLPGSGLGLAIVAQVATEADGSIEASRSEALGGAKLVLRLPRRPLTPSA
jgi:two-component system sensor histidine kinase MprB